MPYFDQKRKKWKGVIKKDGQRHIRMFRTKTEAKSWEASKRNELENPVPTKAGTDMDFLTASNDYLDFAKIRFSSGTFLEKKKLCRDLLKRWGKVGLDGITPTMVLKYLEDRVRRTSLNAWNRDRKNLLAMFNWLRKVHGVTNNPVINIDRMSEERGPEYIPPSEDIDKVMLAASGQDRVMVKCYYYTFARRSEILDWTWDDVNFEKEWYRLWTKKRLHGDRQADYFPMPKGSDLHEALVWQWNHRDKNSPYVFTNPETGGKFNKRPLFINRLCKRAGVRPFGYKAFRKFGPSVLNDIHKVSIKKLQRLLRHKTQTTTEIYLKKIDDDLSVGLRLLERRDTQRDTQTGKGLTANG
jgi:integrase